MFVCEWTLTPQAGRDIVANFVASPLMSHQSLRVSSCTSLSVFVAASRLEMLQALSLSLLSIGNNEGIRLGFVTTLQLSSSRPQWGE